MGIRDWFRTPPEEDREILEEIAFHVDRATQENLAKGMGADEARAEALRRFGDVERVRRECRTARGQRVAPAVGWAAVGALAAVSFLAGWGMHTGFRSPFSPPFTESVSLYVTAHSQSSRIFEPVDWSLIAIERSPFNGTRWRDGVPEVTLDGQTWMQLVSVDDIEAATLREVAQKARGGRPDGHYLDLELLQAARTMGKLTGPTTKIVLKRLDDSAVVTLDVTTAGIPRVSWKASVVRQAVPVIVPAPKDEKR